jgi:carbon storage regulator CsrA
MKPEVIPMLVLTRRNHETVVIGGSFGFERILKVTVVEIQGEKVKLGFEVDGDIPVHRLEVYERIIAGGRLANPKPPSLVVG